MAIFSNQAKNTSTWTNTDKITGTGLWSNGTFPWQELLPWQMEA